MTSHWNWTTPVLVAGLLLTTWTAAPAEVLLEKSPGQKLRADVAKQLAGYVKCLASAAQACEKTGANLGLDCDVANGATAPGADPKAKFAAQVAKCDAKLDFDKKGPDGNTSAQNYELIGCPRFGGGQQLADMDALEDDAGYLKLLINGMVGNIASVSACTDSKACNADSKVALALFQGIAKCQAACENDYKAKLGNGGPTDDFAPCAPSGGLATQRCASKVAQKFLDDASDWPGRNFVAAALVTAVATMNDELFNAPATCQ
jgi:hypothetical protein